MKKLPLLLLVSIIIGSCQNPKEISSIDPVNWDTREVSLKAGDSLVQGSSYLSIYSQIYSQTEHLKHNLTATVSMRNVNRRDSIFIHRAEYFDTHGKLIRTYFEKVIFIAPMETVEIVIDEKDQQGGTGANFLFDWSTKAGAKEPLFEGVMISTSGQQGLSFTTSGIKIE